MPALHVGPKVSLLVPGALGAVVSAQTRYDVTEIKAPVQGSVQLSGMNDLGQVVGAVDQLPQGNFLPFLYSGGTATMLGLPTGYASATPYDINNHEAIVGQASGIFNGLTDQRGFIYRDGQFHLLSVSGVVSAINDAGHIAGVDFTHGEVMFYDGSIHDLGFRGAANAINSNDQIAGNLLVAGATYPNACFYDGTVHDLGVLPGDDSSQAYGLNDAGTVVGMSNSFKVGNVPRAHAFATQNGVMKPLGSLGGPDSEALAINDSGVIVGDAQVAGGNSLPHAFVFDGVMHDLNDLLTTPTDAPLTIASAINNEGQIVALAYSTPDFARGYLLTPVVPEPVAVCFVAGWVALLSRRRIRD